MMKRTAQNRFKALTSACVLSTMATVAWSQTLTWLGTLGGDWSEAIAVSADGSVVVGVAKNAAGQSRAFRWTRTGGMEDLGTLGGSESAALDVSWDGSVVVGWAQDAAGRRWAFRWTRMDRMQDIGKIISISLNSKVYKVHVTESIAHAVSADGSKVIGEFVLRTNSGDNYSYFLWDKSVGSEMLDTYWGTIFDISPDGSILVSTSGNGFWGQREFRIVHRLENRVHRIEGCISAKSAAISANGKVIVGVAQGNHGGDLAVRWREGAGVQILGTLGGDWSRARGVSADGSIVVGDSEDAAENRHAFRWTPLGGMESLNRTYASLLKNGSWLRVAMSISPDGRYIVGSGYNAATKRTEAFLLDTRAPQRVQPQQQSAQQKKTQQKKPRTRR